MQVEAANSCYIYILIIYIYIIHIHIIHTHTQMTDVYTHTLAAAQSQPAHWTHFLAQECLERFETNRARSSLENALPGAEDFQSLCFLTPIAGRFSSLGHFHASEGDERSIACCATCMAKETMLSWSWTVPLTIANALFSV